MMRALTLTQPWCGLVASGIKLVENRGRPMIRREDFGKPFALHASREVDESVYWRIAELAPELGAREMLRDRAHGITGENGRTAAMQRWFHASRVTSAVIGVATIAAAMYIGGCNPEAIADAVLRSGLDSDQVRWTFGPTAYALHREVRMLKTPVRCRGWQGFWTLPEDIEQQVTRQLQQGEDLNA